MTRQTLSKIVALTTCLIALGTIAGPAATAASTDQPITLVERKQAAAQDWREHDYPTKNLELAKIQKRFAETVHVAYDVVKGGHGNFTIGMAKDGTITAERLSGKAPTKVAYPPIGPYWPTTRWLNVGWGVTDPTMHPGHPYVCFLPWDGVETEHPMASAVRRWSTYDFPTRWPSDRTAESTECSQLSDYYTADMESGDKETTCNHVWWSAPNDIVISMKGYWDHEAFNWSCFVDAEINTFRTTTTIGLMQGLLWHKGDGSPSVMSQSPNNPLYLWAQTYDWRAKDYYN